MNDNLIKQVIRFLNSSGSVTVKQIANEFNLSIELVDEILSFLVLNGYLLKEDKTCSDDIQAVKCRHCPFGNSCGEGFGSYSMLSEKALKLK